MAKKGYLVDEEFIEAVRRIVSEERGRLKNPGGIHKRGSVSIGLSSHVVKIKTTITARENTQMGEGTVYLCETDNTGVIDPTTIVKTVYNEGLKPITLSTTQDTYVKVKQTNWGTYVVDQPSSTGNACTAFDGVNISSITGWSTTARQYLAHGTSGCLEWVSGSTCT